MNKELRQHIAYLLTYLTLKEDQEGVDLTMKIADAIEDQLDTQE
tara:strand:+ start:2940 stop:3071 length:132 start_codon:yes stop_codon:yes gene_type:complete